MRIRRQPKESRADKGPGLVRRALRSRRRDPKPKATIVADGKIIGFELNDGRVVTPGNWQADEFEDWREEQFRQLGVRYRRSRWVPVEQHFEALSRRGRPFSY